MGLFSRIKKLFRRKPVRLGLALGSGGAKGMAHLGALKAFEEEGIRFDFITGSSIGAIAGALYARNFRSADMKEIVEGLNRKELAHNFRPFADMTFAEEFLKRYLPGTIEDMPLPFACCATDGETGEAVVLRSGTIAEALTASSAYPPFFRGVELNGKRLYDGAFSNAVPADVCREMGAERVVGIDLSAYVRSPEEEGTMLRLLGSALSAFNPVHVAPDAVSRGYEAADVMLRPDLRKFRATDVSEAAMEEMFEIGYREAKEHIQEIKGLKKKK